MNSPQRPGASARRRADTEFACPHCGRGIATRTDGQRRRHRVRDNDPTASYCTGGAQ